MIHPTAIISPNAQIGEKVQIAPYAVIDENVVIGEACRIGPHVHITGHTTIGSDTVIHAGAVIGDEPQDVHYDGSVTYTEIGKKCHIREYVTVHRGTAAGSKTILGDNVMLMAYSHVGHNCRLANNVILANASHLGGHVQIEERAFLSAGVLLHQFCRVGTLAMIGGVNRVVQDVPPYCLLQDGVIQGVNIIGLRRAGFSSEARKAIQRAAKIYFFMGLNRPNALTQIRQELHDVPEIETFATFIENTTRGIVDGRTAKNGKTAEDMQEPEA